MRLYAEELIAAAEKSIGLSDWGAQDYRTGLDILLDAAAASGHVSEVGWRRLEQRILRYMRNRLEIIAHRNRHPGVASEQIVRPIFIIGMPRSGTSNLLTLLSYDPAHRAPRLWELMSSVPPPRRETYDSDPRIAEVQRYLKGTGYDDPVLNAAHPFEAHLPEECGYIFEHCFAGMPYFAYIHMPEYREYSYNGADWRGVYGYHRQVLQHLQSDYRSERWVLKTPEHALHIRALLDVYPDAILLNTKRDPAKVLPSLTSNFVSLRRIWATPEAINVPQIADDVMENIATIAQRMMAAREDKAVDAHFYDIDFFDLTERPLETMAKVYTHFDLPFTDEARAGIRHYVEKEAKKVHGHGGHSYTLAEFGFTEADIDRRFADYLERFHIKRERRG